MKSSVLARLREVLAGQRAGSGEPSVVQRVTHGAVWSLIGEGVIKGFTVISSILVARMLGREGFGTVGMLQSTLGTFGVLAGFGLGSTTTKYVAEYRRTDPSRAGAITYLTVSVGFVTTGAMVIGCVLMAPWLAKVTLKRPDLAVLLAVAPLMLVGLVIGGIFNATLSGFEAFRELTQIKILQGIVGALATLLLVWVWGVPGAVAAMILMAFFGLLMSALAVRRRFRDNQLLTPDRMAVLREWPALHRFAIPALASSLLVAPTVWITNAMLVRQPGGYGELGLFNAANQWRTLIVFLPAVLSSAMLPILSETFARNDRSEFSRAIAINLRATWIVALPLTMLVIGLAPELSLFFSRQFTGMEGIIPPLMGSCLLMLLSSPTGAALAGAGRMWVGALMNLGWALALIVLTWLLVPRYGGIGLAFAYLGAYLLHFAWTVAYAEMRITPGVISPHVGLIAFTLALLSTGIFAGTGGHWGRLIGVGLFLLSTLPLARTIRAEFLRRRPV